MIRIKKILLALLILFVAIQLIQPAHNKSGQVSPTDFTKAFTVPQNLQNILQSACYDCHSNNTAYPWYSRIQPMAWILKRHIDNGKAKLNFSDFGSYSFRRQVSKLREIANQVKDDEMPLSSYKTMHEKANLNADEKRLIVNWMNNTADSIILKN